MSRPDIAIIALLGMTTLAGTALAQGYIARFPMMGEATVLAGGGSGGGGGNAAPTANAGADQTVESGAGVTLSAVGSTDPDPGDVLSYAWSQSSGPAVTLSDPASATPSFTAPTLISTDPAATLVFSLVVTDDDGAASAADTVSVTVNPPTGPVDCDTPGQTCADGTSLFAGGTYMYASGKFGPLRWDQASAYCAGLGSGWRVLNSPTERNLLAIPGDPLAVDGMVTLWGEAALTNVSGSFVPGVGVVNTCTWSARRYRLRSQAQDGSFVLHTPWGISQDYFTLGTVQTSNQCSTTTPPVNAQTYNFVCVKVTASPIP